MSKAIRLLFLANLFTVTFEKVHWQIAGALALSDVLALAFVLAFVFGELDGRARPWPRTAGVLLTFTVLFLVVYLFGYFNLDGNQAIGQFAKGLYKFALHFLLLLTGVVYLARRSQDFYWKALAAFFGGIFANSAYGIVQLVAAGAGFNLDNLVLSRITGGASMINIYGRVDASQAVYRVNALTGDPNHLGVFLVLPILVLLPIALRLEKGHPQRGKLAALLIFFGLVELSTLSRSGLLGLLAGGLVLVAPYRRKLVSRTFLRPLGIAAGIVLVIFVARFHFFWTVLKTRVGTGGSSTHFAVYSFVPDVLRMHPLFGLGLNTFSVYYQQVTGLTNWGPHSFYVSILVETGLFGTTLYAAFLLYLFHRLGAVRALGRRLAAHDLALSRRVSPLGWGMTAAVVGTLASNLFYLTLPFYYFYAFAILALCAPIVFARGLPEPARAAAAPARTGAARTAPAS